MRRIHTGADLRAEPNLTPLLDLVLQLLMFFMICANFVRAQANENIQLPVMQSARPLEDTGADVLYLNLSARGALEVVGQAPIERGADKLLYLRREYDDARRLSRERGLGGEVSTTVVVRADEAVPYRELFALLDGCKRVGYRKLQVRGKTRADGQPGAQANAGSP
jgi:biopolymer transport protein ExbD